MKVYVVFDFPAIKDPDSAAATNVVDMLSAMTKEWSSDMGDQCHVYVDDAVGDVPKNTPQLVSDAFDQLQEDMRNGLDNEIEYLLEHVPTNILNNYVSKGEFHGS